MTKIISYLGASLEINVGKFCRQTGILVLKSVILKETYLHIL